MTVSTVICQVSTPEPLPRRTHTRPLSRCELSVWVIAAVTFSRSAAGTGSVTAETCAAVRRTKVCAERPIFRSKQIYRCVEPRIQNDVGVQIRSLCRSYLEVSSAYWAFEPRVRVDEDLFTPIVKVETQIAVSVPH